MCTMTATDPQPLPQSFWVMRSLLDAASSEEGFRTMEEQ